MQFPPYSADNKCRLIETIVAPAVLSAEYDSPTHAWNSLTEKTRRWAIQSGEPGPIAACLAGLDLAMWDLVARKKNVRLSQFLNPQVEKLHVQAASTQTRP